jgi:hypothetical protein
MRYTMKRFFSLFALSLFLPLAAVAQHTRVVVVVQRPVVRTYFPGTYVSGYGIVPPVDVAEPTVDPVVAGTPVVVTPLIVIPVRVAPAIVVRRPIVITRNRR